MALMKVFLVVRLKMKLTRSDHWPAGLIVWDPGMLDHHDDLGGDVLEDLDDDDDDNDQEWPGVTVLVPGEG